MSEKTAKAARREENKATGEVPAFIIKLAVMQDGRYMLDVPKDTSMPIVIDVLMRAQRRVWEMFWKKASGDKSPIIRPPGGIPEGVLRRPRA